MVASAPRGFSGGDSTRFDPAWADAGETADAPAEAGFPTSYRVRMYPITIEGLERAMRYLSK